MNEKKLRFIVSFAKPYKYRFLIILLVILTTTYLGMTYLYLFGKMVDSLYYNYAPERSNSGPRSNAKIIREK
ncbi:hypothetical protein [Ruminiclostridium josui]|uniref:hypothetical protein n=1 Tax=Ruminiclostridium josui TaxID=1499 RepID=UPI000463A127|nr:hypothetical protein [Ruminiclostridium josui]